MEGVFVLAIGGVLCFVLLMGSLLITASYQYDLEERFCEERNGDFNYMQKGFNVCIINENGKNIKYEIAKCGDKLCLIKG